MFERFTERARKVIILAREEAIRLGHNFVGTEHLLLGLIREGDGLAVAILKKLNVSISALKAEIEKIVAVGTEFSPAGEIPFTPQAKKVLEDAISEARSLGHNYIGTEHLLLGLLGPAGFRRRRGGCQGPGSGTAGRAGLQADLHHPDAGPG